MYMFSSLAYNYAAECSIARLLSLGVCHVLWCRLYSVGKVQVLCSDQQWHAGTLCRCQARAWAAGLDRALHVEGRQPCMCVSVQVCVVIIHCPLLLCIKPSVRTIHVIFGKWCSAFFQLQAKQHHCAGRLDMLLKIWSKVWQSTVTVCGMCCKCHKQQWRLVQTCFGHNYNFGIYASSWKSRHTQPCLLAC